MAKRWLQKCFRDFVVELERQKVAVAAGDWKPVTGSDRPFDAAHAGQRGPNSAWEGIANLLREQEAEVGRAEATGLQLYRQAQYAMVALADETFRVSLGDWSGREGWMSYSIEMAFYQTQYAGEELFRRIDALLERRDPGERDLAEIYYLVLSLGFQGKYGPLRDRARLEELRQLLYNAFTERRDAPLGVVSQQPYEYVESGTRGANIPSASRSLSFLAIVTVFLLVATFIAGIWFTSSIREQVERIDADNAYHERNEEAGE